MYACLLLLLSASFHNFLAFKNVVISPKMVFCKILLGLLKVASQLVWVRLSTFGSTKTLLRQDLYWMVFYDSSDAWKLLVQDRVGRLPMIVKHMQA